MSQDKSNPQLTPEEEQGFIGHLIELRDRVLRMVLAIIIVFIPMFYFNNELYHYLAEPLTRVLPQGSSIIATEVASPFLIPFKLSLVLSVFAAMPYILYQFWGFVAPGLYQHERKLVMPLLVTSTFLFYVGIAFAYYVVFPLVFKFFTSVAPEGVKVMTDISHYLDFVLRLFFAFGFAFEVPIATIVMCWTGMTTPEKLAAKRPYVVVAAFVIGMLLTPPDVISQTLLAVPMWALFELGVVFSRFYVPKKEEQEEEEEEEHSIMSGAGATAAAATATAATNAAGTPVSRTTAPATEQDDLPEEDSNESGHQEYEPFDDEYREMTDDELDAEMDRIDREMDELMDEDEEEADRKKDQDKGKSPEKKE